MDLLKAQEDMRTAYYGGAPGVLVSALVWLAAGIVTLNMSPKVGMLVLFFGGMAIFPLGILVTKLLGRKGAHNADNGLARLAIESTVLLFIGLFIAFSVAQLRIEWFFPIMLLTIGGRYLVFATLYGMRIYWLLGGFLTLAGAGFIMLQNWLSFAALTGGVIELILAIAIFRQHAKISKIQSVENEPVENQPAA